MVEQCLAKQWYNYAYHSSHFLRKYIIVCITQRVLGHLWLGVNDFSSKQLVSVHFYVVSWVTWVCSKKLYCPLWGISMFAFLSFDLLVQEIDISFQFCFIFMLFKPFTCFTVKFWT